MGLSLFIHQDGKTCGICNSRTFELRKVCSCSRNECIWRCTNEKRNKSFSVRIKSQFENHKLTSEKIVLITQFLAYKVSETFVRNELETVYCNSNRCTKRCSFTTLADGTKETLLGIINANMLPGTTIISDCSKAYYMLDKVGLEHFRINYKQSVVYQDTRGHTNIIEPIAMWRALKKSLLVSETVKSHFDTFQPIKSN